MSVFDCWVDNRDRINQGNLLVSEGVGGSVRVAYIDYSLSLSNWWTAKGVPEPDHEPGRYPTDTVPDATSAEQTLVAIERLSEGTIRAIVDAVPDDFLAADRKDRIEEGLLTRRTKLRGVVEQMYRGV
jgi:hypothetical protein